MKVTSLRSICQSEYTIWPNPSILFRVIITVLSYFARSMSFPTISAAGLQKSSSIYRLQCIHGQLNLYFDCGYLQFDLLFQMKLPMKFSSPNTVSQSFLRLTISLSSIDIKITPSSRNRFLAKYKRGYIIFSHLV